MNRRTLILVNPACHQGRGWKRWLSIKTEVAHAIHAPWTEFVLEPGVQLSSALPPLLKAGQYEFIISAGGDGSLHYLLNALLKSCASRLDNLSLGAIGLGSSNDFLKPFNRTIKNIPTRIDLLSTALKYDVGLARYGDETGHLMEKYFIVNASFGVTALANRNFNRAGKFLKFLKAHSTKTAIAYTALTTILRYNNFQCHLNYRNNRMYVPVSNINIVKIPFVAGSLRYPQRITPDDGKLGLYICKDMNKIDLLRTLSQLEKGTFEAGDKTIAETIDQFHLVAPQPVIFECDGETSMANNITISVVQKAINVLSC